MKFTTGKGYHFKDNESFLWPSDLTMSPQAIILLLQINMIFTSMNLNLKGLSVLLVKQVNM